MSGCPPATFRPSKGNMQQIEWRSISCPPKMAQNLDLLHTLAIQRTKSYHHAFQHTAMDIETPPAIVQVYQ